MKPAAERAQFRGRAVDVVIDVRSKLEFWLGHLPGAICIPVDTIPHAVLEREDIRKDSLILLYCASGARSAAALRALDAAGYRQVVDGGGMAAASAHFTPAGGH
jgi:phage shock protein E